MEDKKYVTYGSCCANVPGEKQDITTCNFTLAPMTDTYADIILGALKKLDTSRIWNDTNRLGTVYRGKRDDVFDAVEACFTYAWKKDVHMTMEMTLSKGCPGESDRDYLLSNEEGLANKAGYQDIHFPVDCKWSLYPLGSDQYMKGIADVVNESIDLGLFVESIHGCTMLKGDVADLFAYFNRVFRECEKTFSHFVMEITMSVNAPD